MEHPPKKNPEKSTAEFDFSINENIANLWERGKKTGYALSFLSCVAGANLETEAHAVEIEPTATYEQGIEKLRDATLHEKFETGAIYIKYPDGSTKWLSNKGSIRNPMIGGKRGLENTIDIELLKENEKWVGVKGVIEIELMHNHPLYSAQYAGMLQTDTVASIPPSGLGYSAISGDASILKTSSMEQDLEKWKGRINLTEKVVDPFGVWEYRLVDDQDNIDSEAYTIWNELSRLVELRDSLEVTDDEYKNKEVNINQQLETLRTRLNDLVKEATEIKASYIQDSTQIKKPLDIMQLDSFQKLIASYQTMGVVVTFSPFED